MRTNIDIDDNVLEAAMKAGPFKTKKEAVEAGLRLVARQAAYREILRWEGRLSWDGDSDSDSSPAPAAAAVWTARAGPDLPRLAAEPEPPTGRAAGSTGRRRAGR